MSWIYIDCETIADQTRGPNADEVKAPANYKDPVKIREYKLEHALEQWEKTSLNRWRCSVVAVAVITDEMVEPLVWMSMQEADIFAKLAAFLDHVHPEDAHPNAPEPIWCGHNAVGFDFPILSMRAFRYGHARLGREMRPGHPKWGDNRHKDTLIAAGGEGKLDDLARFFGISRKKTIGGDEIGKAWMTQRFSAIADHISDDVLTQRAVTQHMRDRGMFG